MAGPFGTTASVYDLALERIAIMDTTGHDAVWLAEHHFSSFSVCPSVHMMGVMAAAPQHTFLVLTGVTQADEIDRFPYLPSTVVASIADLIPLVLGQMETPAPAAKEPSREPAGRPASEAVKEPARDPVKPVRRRGQAVPGTR